MQLVTPSGQPLKSEPTESEADTPGETRYKVGVVQEVVKCFTIFAANPDEAIKRCSEGYGVDAGLEGPRTIVVMSKEMASGLSKTTFFDAYDNMRRNMATQEQQKQKKEEPKIIVPTMVPPRGVR